VIWLDTPGIPRRMHESALSWKDRTNAGKIVFSLRNLNRGDIQEIERFEPINESIQRLNQWIVLYTILLSTP
jgi:hypothetical protein